MLRTLLLAAAVTALAAPALARPGDDPQEPEYRVVHYGDLDLDYQADANRAVTRIEMAANQVCGRTDGRRSIQDRVHDGRCGRLAERQAVADIGHPNVTGSYYGYRAEVIIDDDGDGKPDKD